MDGAHGHPVLRLGTRDPGGRQAPVRAQQPAGAHRELTGDLGVHRAPLGEQRAAHPEHLALDLGGIGRDRAAEGPGGPRHVGDGSGHEAAGQRLGDGQLARRWDRVTDFGKIADPIADKAIMGAALVCLSLLDDLPWWVTATILARELGITLMRFWVIRHGVIPASRGGKLKTLTQGIAVGMYILALTGPLATLRWWAMALAVVLTVATGLDYVRQAVVLRRRGLARERADGR